MTQTRISRPSRGKQDGYAPAGTTLYLQSSDQYVTILESGKRRDEDEDRWICWAQVRPATEDEIASRRAQRDAQATTGVARERLLAIHAQVDRDGRLPDDDRPDVTGGRIVTVESRKHAPDSTLTLIGETLISGYYDDARTRRGRLIDATLASEAATLADQLGR